MITKKINSKQYRVGTTLYTNMIKEQVTAYETLYGVKCSGYMFRGRYDAKTGLCAFFHYEKSRKNRGWFVTTYQFKLDDVVYAQQYDRHFVVSLR